MRINKLFIPAGTLALAIAGFLSSKANNKKFAAALSAYVYTGGTNIYTFFKGVSSAVVWNLTLINTSKTFFASPDGISISCSKVFGSRNINILSLTVFCK